MPLEKLPQIFDRMNRLGLGICQRLQTISCFWYIFLYFFAFSETPLKQFFNKSEITISKQFCLKFIFCFWLKAQKSVDTCVNCVLKVEPFFVNLSSKVLPDFRARDTICPLWKDILNLKWLYSLMIGLTVTMDLK